MILPRPRAYVDWTVPLNEDGNEIGVCNNDESYSHYLRWLADYLYTKVIPIPENQKSLLEEYMPKGADHAVLDLSDMLGYSIWEAEAIEQQSAQGVPFAQHHETELEAWNELPAEDKQEWTEDDFFTSQDDYMRLGSELLDSQSVPSHIRHADIPYRPILAALFKDIPDATKRYELLDYFYCNFNECASK